MKMWRGFNLLVSRRRSPGRRLKRFPKSPVQPLRMPRGKHRRRDGDDRRSKCSHSHKPMKSSQTSWRSDRSDQRGGRRHQSNQNRSLNNNRITHSDRHGNATSPMQRPQRRSGGKGDLVNRSRTRGMALSRRSSQVPRLRCPWLTRRSCSGIRR